ncbi:MAG: hypothetical protein Q7J25_05525 [Vicinamibacterales bacterium]|nr:hypothetical protein [Vicinamibacterales bacterium]
MIGAVTMNAGAASAQRATQSVADQRQARYEIAQMERVLEGAVEHGVANIRDRLQALGPTELLISDNARARGFRLDGYGVFFDVVVPSLDTTVLWSIRTLDQNSLGLQSALRELEAHVKQAGNVNLEQALRRIELQVDPLLVARAATPATPVASGARNATGSVAAATVDAPQQAADPVFANPDEVYRAEVTRALMEALLDHSSSLGIESSEWLTIAARRNDERPRLAPADTDARTFLIRLWGSDLAPFLARQITREEALKRIEVRVF